MLDWLPNEAVIALALLGMVTWVWSLERELRRLKSRLDDADLSREGEMVNDLREALEQYERDARRGVEDPPGRWS